MAEFSDLPNELVLELWHHVLPPEDIASFALVSKRIYALAAESLKEHHRLRSKYSTVANYRSCDQNVFVHLLKEVLLTPHIASYVKAVYVDDWRDCWEDWPLESYPERDMDLFREGIRKAEFLLPGDVDDWISILESGNEEPILGLLLSLLPKLCTLRFGNSPVGHLILETIRLIAETTNSKSLSELRSIHMSYDVYDRDTSLSFIKPFALLPSMEKISCRNFHHPIGACEVPDFTIAPRSSNVTELVIDSLVGLARYEYDSMLFKGIKGLKRFTHVSNYETHHPFSLRSALLSHCGHSLEYLKMRCVQGIPEYMGSLASFEKLKTLDIEHSLLVDWNASDGFDIASTLPTSIEAIDINGQFRVVAGYIRPVVTSLANAKRTRLPNLETLNYNVFGNTLGTDEDLDKDLAEDLADMRRLCEINGVVLKFQ
ncbi:hypothetical protein IMSHALPRED_010845 [Imshaugia aleurites]|uniref:F-box domain-containing protein n=1 Tax=Imshaugia aleurites TaxID=172621 RepID=A0A8H3G501_9LECA|nr:hypothetical protein IMSHALPRED_010845 [Imshaugia aleurites]